MSFRSLLPSVWLSLVLHPLYTQGSNSTNTPKEGGQKKHLITLRKLAYHKLIIKMSNAVNNTNDAKDCVLQN